MKESLNVKLKVKDPKSLDESALKNKKLLNERQSNTDTMRIPELDESAVGRVGPSHSRRRTSFFPPPVEKLDIKAERDMQ